MSGKYRGVPAAEKYAELEAAGEARPLCDCHGREMKWQKEESLIDGGRWRCGRSQYETTRSTPERTEYYRIRDLKWKNRKYRIDPEWAARELERKREWWDKTMVPGTQGWLSRHKRQIEQRIESKKVRIAELEEELRNAKEDT